MEEHNGVKHTITFGPLAEGRSPVYPTLSASGRTRCRHTLPTMRSSSARA